ncbi:MAG: decaprenyl-phosphate phosphoribosyltransferase [Planctomycetes bacterium]|nr:decaprenyl-phosphate phosphoribosyltransferase [Planctomycetota bacterium]
MRTLRALVVSARPWQWLKNLAVLPGLIFARRAGVPADAAAVALAFLVFCLASSAGYFLNDVLDREKDRLHPAKKSRPIARGDLSAAQALLAALLLAATSLALAWFLGERNAPLPRRFVLFPALYLALILAYSLLLKRIVLVDVLALSAGLMLRVIAGGAVIQVEISSWLLICTFFLAAFLGLAKRRAEFLNVPAQAEERPTRPVLSAYDSAALDILIGATTSALLLSYVLYTVSEHTVEMFGTRNLFFTIPIAFYGVGRYLFLVLRPAGGEDPTLLLWRDRPLQAAALLWLLAVLFILYA